jgi:hypothetical protein
LIKLRKSCLDLFHSRELWAKVGRQQDSKPMGFSVSDLKRRRRVSIPYRTVSRSKHTDPDFIRAARRLQKPDGKRDGGDLTRAQSLRRRLKENGLVFSEHRTVSGRREVWPKVLVQPPSEGFHHPAGKRDILDYLRSLGPVARYGLRTVELVRVPFGHEHDLQLGRYEAPGRIILFEQRSAIWRLRTKLSAPLIRSLRRKGAVIFSRAEGTTVEWVKGALRRFMLEEVLSHEIGHHILQQYKGKRAVRIARNRDHEKFAARFVKKQDSKKDVRG